MILHKIIGIAACDPEGVMGKNGRLPWRCPEELRHFSSTIDRHPLVMGYKTFLSMPAHYFEKQSTIIFSRHKHTPTFPEQQFVSSLDEFLRLAGAFSTLYVIGGAEIYRLFFEARLMTAFLLTRMKRSYDGDTFFPLSSLDGWNKQILSDTPEFTIYKYEPPYAYKNP
jgi:dihydrofolate reductase